MPSGGTRIPPKTVVLGVITGAIGIRGEVRVKTFTEDPENLGTYGPLSDRDGKRSFEVKKLRPAKGGLALKLKGIDDRDTAQALKGTELCVPREALGEADEDEYFHVDLIGLEALDEEGKLIGRVKAVHDFGAGDVLDIRLEDGKSELVAFTREAVPEVDVKGGHLVVRLEAQNEEAQGEGEDG